MEQMFLKKMAERPPLTADLHNMVLPCPSKTRTGRDHGDYR
jgi:hypothetical protein